MSVTDWLTDSLADDLVLKIEWIDVNMQIMQTMQTKQTADYTKYAEYANYAE